ALCADAVDVTDEGMKGTCDFDLLLPDMQILLSGPFEEVLGRSKSPYPHALLGKGLLQVRPYGLIALPLVDEPDDLMGCRANVSGFLPLDAVVQALPPQVPGPLEKAIGGLEAAQ